MLPVFWLVVLSPVRFPRLLHDLLSLIINQLTTPPGLAIGAISVNVPNYNAEVAPPEVRGSLVALQQLAITAGIMVSFWIDYGTNNIGGTGTTQSDAAWLVPICLQLIPGITLGVGMLFMPFSPRWLVHHGREAEARHVLSKLRNLESDHELIELEFLEIKAQSIFEKRTTAEKWPGLVEITPLNTFKLQWVAIGSLFTTRAMFRRVIVATVTMFFQQFTGINAVLYYSPFIFTALGTSSNTTSLLATGVVGVAMFLATIPAVLYIDKLGRKPVMLAGALGMGICHMTIAVIFAKNQYQWATHKAAGWAAVAMVWLFVVHFGYSWGPWYVYLLSPLSSCSSWAEPNNPLTFHLIFLINHKSAPGSLLLKSGPSPIALTASPLAPPRTGCPTLLSARSRQIS